jgi:L-ascorbate metabolism protein UlaG (beta-lactamase superfamily)
MDVTYVGHATVLVELDGARLLTDPVLRKRVLHLRRAAPAAVEKLHDLDAVLISHAHWDHLDGRSLRQLGRDLQIVIPRGAGKLVRRAGFADVVEIDLGGRLEFGAMTVTATRAEHDASRGPFGVRTPAFGYLFEGSQRIFFAGDTDLFPELAELAPVDLALLPVGGWGPRTPAGHLDPRRAAEALALLRARVAIPIHWGTYAGMSWSGKRGSFDRTPAEEFARHAAGLAPDADVRIIPPGGSVSLG